MTTDDSYYVVLDGKTKTGPFQAEQVIKMLESGTVTDSTPIWAKGMEGWNTVGGIRTRLLPDEPPPFEPGALPAPVNKEPTPTEAPPPDAKNREEILELQQKLAALPDDPGDIQVTLKRQRIEKSILELKGVKPKVAARRRPRQDFDPNQGMGDYGGSGEIQPSPGKSGGIAAALSVLFVGLGQIYLGQVAKGIAMLIAALVIGGCSGLAFWPLLLLVAPTIWIAAAVDAYMVGKKLEDGQSVGQWEFFGGG